MNQSEKPILSVFLEPMTKVGKFAYLAQIAGNLQTITSDSSST
jgi:hypothetical protein